MDVQKRQAFVSRMGKKRTGFARGGPVKRENFANGGAAATGALSGAAAGAAVGTIIPGVGNVIGAIGGGLIGGLSGLFSGSGPQMPNITDPVTGQQITDANGNVIATQDQLVQFAKSFNGINGVQAQQAVMGQLQGVVNGTGPNPAQAQLNQATGANVANTAALMAGQRGAASNVGLIAREAAQQGAATQQQAVQQGATLQAEQSLGALGQEGGIAGQQVAEQQAALGAANASALQNQSNILGAQTNYNNAVTGGQGNVNTNNTSTTNALIPAALGAAGGIGAAFAKNGSPKTPATPGQTTSSIGNQAGETAPGNVTFAAKGGRIVEGPHKSHVANFLAMAQGGKVPAMVSPGEVYLSPDKVEKVMREGANPMEIGERIPGKAKVRGDSRKNDFVARTLDEGGVVIPRHIATHRMAPEKAELFVHRAMARKARK